MGNNCCISRNGGPDDGVYFPAELGSAKKMEDGKCIIARKKVIRDCPKGHPLKAFVTPRAGYHCDVCRPTGLQRPALPAGTTLWACRSCSYDVCTTCRGTEEPDPDPPDAPEPKVQRFSFDLSDEEDDHSVPNTELERIYERAFTNQRVVKCPFGVWAVRIDKAGLSGVADDPSASCPPLVADYMDTKGATDVYEAFMGALARRPPGEDGTRHHSDIWQVYFDFHEQFRLFDIGVFVCQLEDERAEAEQPEEEPDQYDRDGSDGATSAGSECGERAPPCQWVTFVDIRQAPNYVAEHSLAPPPDLPPTQEADEEAEGIDVGVKNGGGRGPAGGGCEAEVEGREHAGHDAGGHYDELAGRHGEAEEESSCSSM